MNHPSSFLEACVMACWLPVPLHFIVRGDVFHPYFRWFFSWTNQIPIYRFRDGFSQLRHNHKTFASCYRKLSERATILIFSEGSTQWVKRLRPLQRGTARLAFGALEHDASLDLQVVPVGIYFEDIFKIRSHVYIEVGTTIDPSSYLNNTDGRVKQLTKDLYDGMMACMAHLNDTSKEKAFNVYSSYLGIDPAPPYSIAKHRILASQINNMQVSSIYINRGMSYAVEQEDRNIKYLYPSHRVKPSMWQYVAANIFYYLLALIYEGPARLSIFLSKKITSHPSFVIPVRIGISMVLYLVLAIVLLFTLLFWLGWWGLGVLLVYCFGILLYLFMLDLRTKWNDAYRWRQWTNDNQNIQTELEQSIRQLL